MLAETHWYNERFWGPGDDEFLLDVYERANTFAAEVIPRMLTASLSSYAS